MKRGIKLTPIICLLLFTNFKYDKKNKTAKGRDFVPDEQTAIKVAGAIWLPIFGASIYEDKPFIATLKDNVWLVTGTPPTPGSFGGTVMIKIRKSDCKILLVAWPK